MKYLITLLILSFSLLGNSQNVHSITTHFVKSPNSKICAKETFNFRFTNQIVYKKTDKTEVIITLHDNSSYDEKGRYYEIWSPYSYLDMYGITEYNKIRDKRVFKIVFDKKNGEVLYVFEAPAGADLSRGLFYFTNKGYEVYCN